ncbi:hypothetical protein JTB14_020320 [Gonioctena quinquepunctata]|nr:hypothetical protein JTB14_020320 [Gonioctena quinquepunctata]
MKSSSYPVIILGITFFLATSFITQVKSMIAYDCDDKDSEISAVSIRDVAECPEINTAYYSESGTVKVIQRDEISLQHVWTCLIEVTRLISHCGMHSHSSVVAGGIMNYIYRVGAEECRSIHRYRTLKIYQQNIGGITMNGTTTASLTLEGVVDPDGTCEGSTYHENGQVWKDVVIIATIKIQVTDYLAKMKLDENEISLIGGVVCPFLKGYCFDTNLGETTWEVSPLRTCEEKLSLLYHGQAEKIKNQFTTEQIIVVEDNTKREILRTRLLMAPLVPSTLSQLVKESGGYVGRVLGEVLYIMRCVPRTVAIRRTEKCYNELPIVVNNASKFMAPVTRIIQTHAEEVDCNGLMPPLYLIDDQWMGLSPYPTIKKAPEVLSPESNLKLTFFPIQPVGTLGIYTQEEISNAQRILTFGNERKAVENIIARRVAGLETTGQGFSTVNLFNTEEMKELAHNTIRQVWGWFTDLGLFMSGLMGFYAIFRIIKYGIGVILNGIQLYQTLGCGVMILASLWNNLTMWVTHRHHQKVGKAKTDPVVDQPTQLNEVTT